jgi:hypothetical protein
MAEPKTRLILTGGTLGMRETKAGTLVPAPELLDKPAAEAGFKNIKKFIPIDSIDFNVSKHYSEWRQEVQDALEHGETPVICGGTDTIVWYSTLLTKDMMRRGYLQPGSHQKIVFLSSMTTYEANPELVVKVLRAGKLLAEQPDLTGGFAVAAETKDGQIFAVHDVLNHFDKIGHEIFKSLRSAGNAGMIVGNTFAKTAYAKPPTPKPTDKHRIGHIAPPLLRKQKDSNAVLAYMNMIANAEQQFDGILIEGLPAAEKGKTRLLPQLISVIERLRTQGIHVTFCNPVRYDPTTETMLPIINPAEWANDPARKPLETAGAMFATGLPKDVYIDMALNQPDFEQQRYKPPTHVKTAPQEILGIRYVPDAVIMNKSLEAIAPQTANLVFSALPNNEMPAMVAEAGLEKFKKDRKYFSTFEYNSLSYRGDDGKRTTVGPGDVQYEAAVEMRKLVTPLSSGDPISEALAIVRGEGSGLSGSARIRRGGGAQAARP